MKIGLLFAGQGSQRAGMGADFYEEMPAFRAVFDLLPEDKKQLAWNGPEEALRETENTQPIMTAFGLGVWSCFREQGLRPACAAGLSLGEYSAQGASGAVEEDTAIRLVTRRGREMAKAAKGIRCGMTAVLGADPETVESCCEEASEESAFVQIANYNCPGQIVIAGESGAVDRAAALAKERGARRCMPLPVSGPFHTQYMKPAGDAMAEVLGKTVFQAEDFPVIHNVTGRPAEAGETIPELLVRQVSGSVRFEETIRYMLARGVDTFLEIGPGCALAGFVRKTDRRVKTCSVSTVEDFQAALESLGLSGKTPEGRREKEKEE